MTLQELKYIVTLANTKHFGRASLACFVSQPTLSIGVKKVEEELGVILFERQKNEVYVTPIGQAIITRAKRILTEVEAIKLEAAQDKDDLSSRFRLGAIFTVGPYLLPPLIMRLHKLAPQLPIEIIENYTSALRERLLNGDCDAIVISLPFEDPHFHVEPLYEEPFMVLMPITHPLTRFKQISEQQLSQYNVLLLGEGHCLRDQVMATCPQCFIGPRNKDDVHWQTVEGSSLETIRHMVASGLGVTVLPMSAAYAGPYQDKLLVMRPLRGKQPKRVIAVAYRKTYPRKRAISVILQALLDSKLNGVSYLRATK